MKVEYICHACLLIDTGDLRFVTDPWFAGPAYCRQWHVFPRPVDTQVLDDADVILISHGHEDHLHEPTLRQMRKSARIFCPFSLFGDTKEYLEELGFERVTEAVAYRKYQVNEKTSVTYVPNSHDNIIIIESGGQVLVNANDALHSYPHSVIDFYVDVLRQGWPRIDYLFCGFGGASYFPNSVHLAGKNDRDIGEVREQLFAHNFCRVVAGLKPRIAAPFAADFALLSPAQRWINEVRFPRALMSRYYHQYFEENDHSIQEMYPGDILDGFTLQPKSNYRQRLRNGRLDHLVPEQYKKEIEELEKPVHVSEDSASLLVKELRQNIEERINRFPLQEVAALRFYLQITDVPDNAFYNVQISGKQLLIERSPKPGANCMLGIKTSSAILRHSFGSEWGGDALSIGYGCEIDLFTPEAANLGLDKICLNLLSRSPTGKTYLWKDPLRSLRYLMQSRSRWWARRKLKDSETVTYDSRVWLLKDKSELREMYELPTPNLQ